MTKLLGIKSPIEIIENILRDRFVENIERQIEDHYLLLDNEDNEIFVAVWEISRQIAAGIVERIRLNY